MIKNFKLKILAVLSSIFLWIVVINIQNDFYVVPDKPEIKAFNLSENLVVKGQLGAVILTIQADQNELKNIATQDFDVYVDLKNARAGTEVYPVAVSPKKANIKVLKVEPSTISVVTEEIRSKALSVNYKIEGNVADGFQLGNVEFEPKELIAKGSKEDLERADGAMAILILSGKEQDAFAKTVLAKAVDTEGELIESLKFETEEVRISAKVDKGAQSKTVGIEPLFSGELASGWISNITINPSTVKIVGSEEFIRNLDKIKTQNLDISAITTSQQLSIPLQVPANIKLADGESGVVEVNIQVTNVVPESDTQIPAEN